MSKEEILENNKKECSHCGSASTLPISYGLIPDEVHEENAKDRKWVWGGCVIKVGGNTDHCNDCGKSFGGDSYEEEPFDEESFLKDREKLFSAIDKFLDEERDEDLYAQALKEAEGDEVEAEHIYFSYIRSQFYNNESS
jgi:hypothetical protein